MPILKSFKFRVYPSAEQVERLGRWNDALRFLWNLANEQRLMGLARCGKDKRYLFVFDQNGELPALRAELPWLADVPSEACQQLLVELDRAWQRHLFAKIDGTPKWKKKRGRHFVTACLPRPQSWRLGHGQLRFSKLGPMRVVQHRALEGRPKTCRLVRDVDQWFAVVTCEVELPERGAHPGPPVGIDRGVVNAFADSTGRLVENPRFLAQKARRIAHAQRVAARRKKGSKNRTKAQDRVANLYRKVRRQRDHFLHVESARYAKNHGVIVLEKLDVRAMTASASGTVEAPGTNVAQKRGLNRAILDVGWGRFASFSRYKANWAGGEVREVVAAYSSQTCSKCGHCCAENRPTQALFRCVKCGHAEHADVNAARVILARGLTAVEPTVAGCGGSAEVRRPKKQQLRVARRGKKATTDNSA